MNSRESLAVGSNRIDWSHRNGYPSAFALRPVLITVHPVALSNQ